MIIEYEKLTFTNSFMFCNILQKDPELCKEIVETLLDVKIREIISTNDEETIKPNSDGHGVRLDVYMEGDDAVYDIEMQTADTGNIRKRSRYYQGVLDTDYLKKGQNYNKLKKTYIIFICTFDLFNQGLPKYTFSNTCAESPDLQLGDEAIKVFINAHGVSPDSSPAFKEFLKYITEAKVSGRLTERIENNLQEALKNEGMRAKYMTFEWELESKYREGMEKGMEAGMEKGMEAGVAAGNREAIKKMLTKLLPEDIIAMGFSAEDVEAAREATE